MVHWGRLLAMTGPVPGSPERANHLARASSLDSPPTTSTLRLCRGLSLFLFPAHDEARGHETGINEGKISQDKRGEIGEAGGRKKKLGGAELRCLPAYTVPTHLCVVGRGRHLCQGPRSEQPHVSSAVPSPFTVFVSVDSSPSRFSRPPLVAPHVLLVSSLSPPARHSRLHVLFLLGFRFCAPFLPSTFTKRECSTRGEDAFVEAVAAVAPNSRPLLSAALLKHQSAERRTSSAASAMFSGRRLSTTSADSRRTMAARACFRWRLLGSASIRSS